MQRNEYALLALLALTSFLAVLPSDIATKVLSPHFYLGSAPVFLFSIIIYMAQGLSSLYLFRHNGPSRSIGYTSILLIASYSLYELLFKLTFIGLKYGNQGGFPDYEIYPTAVFIVSIATILSIREKLSFSSRSSVIAFFIVAFAWLAWIGLGIFPLLIQEYEASPTFYPLFFNFETKLFTAAYFVVSIDIQKSGKVARAGSSNSSTA